MANTGWGRRKRVEMQKYAVQASGAATFTTIFAGLDTNTTINDDASNVAVSAPTGTEPTSANGYARQSITAWNTIATPSNDAAALATNSTVLSWTSSGGGFSSGATTLKQITLWTTSALATVTEAAFEGRATIASPQAVNATGITLTIASGGLSMGYISA